MKSYDTNNQTFLKLSMTQHATNSWLNNTWEDTVLHMTWWSSGKNSVVEPKGEHMDISSNWHLPNQYTVTPRGTIIFYLLILIPNYLFLLLDNNNWNLVNTFFHYVYVNTLLPSLWTWMHYLTGSWMAALAGPWRLWKASKVASALDFRYTTNKQTNKKAGKMTP